MSKKIFAFIAAFLMSATAVVTGFGCGDDGGKNPVDSQNVLNVQIYKGGHGTSYIYALAEKFNKLHENDEYSVNVVQPSTTLQGSTIYSLVYADSKVDVFVGSVNATDAVAGAYGQTLLDITDEVLLKPAIKFDGTEEEISIKEKLGDHEYVSNVYNGRTYAIPYVNGSASMGVNMKVLEKYGLEIPKTTNDLAYCIEKIMANSGKTTVRPFACSITGNNYSNIAIGAWLAQYLGKGGYDSLWSFRKENGENMTGQEIIDFHSSAAFRSMFEKLVSIYDNGIQVKGYRTITFDEAQNAFLRGQAAFYLVGDWMLNEESERNEERLSDVDYVRIPFNSDVGVNFFGSASEYKYQDADCEKILKIIIGGADNNEEISEIRAKLSENGFDISEEDVNEICVRRCFVRDRSSGGFCINAKTTKKELAYEFLRFCASTEAGELTAANTNVTSPYAVGTLKDAKYQWVKSACAMLDNRYMQYLNDESVGLRKSIGSTDLITILPTFGEVTIGTIVKEENLCTNFDVETGDVLDPERKVYAEKADYFLNLLKNNITERINGKIWKI